jgi:acyl phosphate:glycerol-3-phosphate acyltransferase
MVGSIYFKIFYIIASYLLGSVVFGYVVARILKKDGFGKVDRPGTAGAGRQYGFKAALPVFIFDCGKGAAIPLIGKAIGLDMVTIIIASLAVLIGHNWPVFFKFRGGGGVATAMGIAVALVPIQFFIILAISLAIGFSYKYTLGKKHKVNSNVIASLIGCIILPITVFLFKKPVELIVLFICVCLVIIIKGIILHLIYRKIPTAG